MDWLDRSALAGNIHRVTEEIIFGGVLLLLALAPLWYGAVDPIPASLVTVLCLFLGLLWLGQRMVLSEVHVMRWDDETRTGFHLRCLRIIPILFAAVAVGVAYVAPLPTIIQKSAAPPTGVWWRRSEEALDHLQTMRAAWSLNPFASAESVLYLLAMVLFFIVCLDGYLDWKRARQAAVALLAICFLVAMAGIIQMLSGDRKILWATVAGPEKIPFGPFINRNHFASWAGMGALVGFGLAAGAASSTAPMGIKNGVANWGGKKGSQRILSGFLAAVCGGSVFLSLSRGGIIGLLAGIVVFCFLRGMERNAAGWWRNLGVLFLSLAVAAWIGAEAVIERLLTVFQWRQGWPVSGREHLFRDTNAMAMDFLPWGAGPGTFAEVFPGYQRGLTDFTFSHAHNEYLQLLAEWGFMGAVLIILAFFVYWRRLVRNRLRRRDHECLAVSAGAAGAVASVLVHSTAEFNLRLPVNALVFAFCAALALKATAARTVNFNIAKGEAFGGRRSRKGESC